MQPSTRRGKTWWRQPVLWLFALLTAAALAASAVTIVIAQRHADDGVQLDQHAPIELGAHKPAKPGTQP